jgi:hypothetical protein
VNPVAFTLLVSVAFHVVAIASGYAIREMLPRPILLPSPPPAEIEIVDVVEVPDVAPMEVAMVDADTIKNLVTIDPVVPTEETMETARPKAIAKGASASAAVTVGEIEAPMIDGPRTVNPLFAMRNGRQIDLRLRPGMHDALDHVPAGTTPQTEVLPSGQLEPSGGGTYRSNQGVFTAKVGRDGSVSLKNARNLRIALPDPRKIPGAISDWAAKEDKIPNDPEKVAINNNRAPDQDTRPDHGKTYKVLGGGFDITDAIMRRKKVDPYAAAKLRYLDSTRDERVQIGNRYKREQLAQSAQLMQKTLDWLWASKVDLAARKQALFELWDDCAEVGSDAMVEGGKAARALVVGAIRARLTGADAYTAAELAAFNKRRQSKAVFEPYR